MFPVTGKSPEEYVWPNNQELPAPIEPLELQDVASANRETMEALRQIPPDDSLRVVTQFNELFATDSAVSDIKDIGAHLFRGYDFARWQGVRFRLPSAAASSETRRALVELGCKIWMEHSRDIMPHIGRVRQSPPLLRCLLSIAHTLQERDPVCSTAKALASVATGCLAASQSPNDLYVTAFKAGWNSMNGYEQAQALLGLAAAFISVKDQTDPVALFVNDFLKDKSLTWALPVMQEACLYVVERRIVEITCPEFLIIGHESKMKMLAIQALFEEMAKPLSNNEPVQRCISGMIHKVMQQPITHERAFYTREEFVSTILAYMRAMKTEVSRIRMMGNTPDIETIAHMLHYHVDEEAVKSAFERFKQALSQMPACEQAWAMLTLFFAGEKSQQAVQILYEFASDTTLGWADPSLQKTCLYCIQQYSKRSENFTVDVYDALRDMVGVIANPSYKDDLPKVYDFLSRMIVRLANNENVQEVIDTWFSFVETLVVRKIEELALITTPEPPPQPVQPSLIGGACFLQ